MEQGMNAILKRVFRRLHYPLDVILQCVRWYIAYPLSLRHLEEMMAERGVSVDHSTVHRWAIKLLPVLEKAFRRRKRPVGKSWRMDETYIKVNGAWKYLYRAVDKDGNTIDFLLRARRDKAAARRYFEKSIESGASFGSGRPACRRASRDACAARGQYRPLDWVLRANSRLSVDGARLSLRAIARKLKPSSRQKSIRIRSSGCSCWYVLFAIRGHYRMARVLHFRFEVAQFYSLAA
ncbi:hypothetical protein WL48_25720 [Burkholderia ubonensis]|nr:hypothetical protein WL48_25720 [Burkholderia ubonensis]KWC46208.1 hypothetical protein WL49_12065 [Burkholderia ubonensis]